jgi:hypothetical protein
VFVGGFEDCSFGTAAAVGLFAAVGVAAVDPGLGVGRDCSGLPRLGLEFDSCPQCLPCQVGADCTVPDGNWGRTVAAAGAAVDAVEQVAVVVRDAAELIIDTRGLWAEVAEYRGCLAAGMDQDYLRPARGREPIECGSLSADATVAVAVAAVAAVVAMPGRGWLPARCIVVAA